MLSISTIARVTVNASRAAFSPAVFDTGILAGYTDRNVLAPAV